MMIISIIQCDDDYFNYFSVIMIISIFSLWWWLLQLFQCDGDSFNVMMTISIISLWWWLFQLFQSDDDYFNYFLVSSPHRFEFLLFSTSVYFRDLKLVVLWCLPNNFSVNFVLTIIVQGKQGAVIKYRIMSNIVNVITILLMGWVNKFSRTLCPDMTNFVSWWPRTITTI